MPLQHIDDNQPAFEVIDSVLSEEAVLGFEYGYATAEPERAGDLGGAVRRFRQRRAGRDRPVHRVRRGRSGAASAAWCCCCRTATRGRARSTRRRASSASCSCAPSTTCRCACRRRRRRSSTCCAGRCCAPFRKPLIVMSPKSLLRHKEAVSPLEELADGPLPDGDRRDREDRREERAARDRLCCGKVYYELVAAPARAQDRRHRDHARSSSSIRSRTRSSRRADREVSEREGSGLVPGRAAEPGRVVPAARVLARRHAAEAGRSRMPAVRSSASPAVGYMSKHVDASRSS